MKNLSITLLLLALFLLTFGSAYAQDQAQAPTGQVQEEGLQKKVAAGTVVVAAMESIGYRAQHQVLEQMKETMQEVGGLIYLGVLISVILTAAMMGSYAPVIWLLVGPPIFVFVSGVDIGGKHNRISSSGPEWKFGAFKDKQNFKEKVMRRANGPVEVSFVFHKYNEIISELYQEIIKKVTSNDETVSMMFMARQRVMEDLFSMQLRDSNALQLAGIFLTQCSSELTLARYIASGTDNPEIMQETSYDTIKKEYCRMFPDPNKRIDDTALEEYLGTLNPAHVKSEPVSCARLWDWLRQITVKDIASQMEISGKAALGPEAATTAIGAAAMFSDVTSAIERRTVAERKAREKVKDPCPVGAGGEKLDGIESQGDATSVLINIVSGLMIRKEQIKGGETGFQMVMGGNLSGITKMENDAVGGIRTNVRGSEAQLRREKGQELATTRKYETFNFLMIFPYFQGALLYGLAFMYPFFAFLILVPGKADGFLNWLALWAWVKSWDIGWAVVMVTDRLLWEVMPHTTYYDIKDQGGYTPVNLMEMHYAGDFAYSLSLYWSIVCLLVTSVPIITAEVILGAKKGISSVFLGGLTDMGERLATAAGTYVASQAMGRGLDQRSAKIGSGMSSQISDTAKGKQDTDKAIKDKFGNDSANQSKVTSIPDPATGASPENTKERSNQQKNRRLEEDKKNGNP